jgi:hypothetical protein
MIAAVIATGSITSRISCRFHRSPHHPDYVFGRIGHDDLAIAKSPVGTDGEAGERKTLEPCAAHHVIADQSRQGISANLPFAFART